MVRPLPPLPLSPSLSVRRKASDTFHLFLLYSFFSRPGRKDKDSFNPPSTFEDRLGQLFVPLSEQLETLLPDGAKTKGVKRRVDLVELSTGLVRNCCTNTRLEIVG